jgi:hypothetical protein
VQGKTKVAPPTVVSDGGIVDEIELEKWSRISYVQLYCNEKAKIGDLAFLVWQFPLSASLVSFCCGPSSTKSRRLSLKRVKVVYLYCVWYLREAIFGFLSVKIAPQVRTAKLHRIRRKCNII